jgi:hypothetical protein
METVKYLTAIIDLIMRQPKIGHLLDKDGFDPEINYGRIGIKNYNAFISLHGLLNGLEEVKTTPIREINNGLGYDFTMTEPITLHFFFWM